MATQSNTESKSMKDILRIYGPAVLLIGAAFFVATQFIKPAPPERVVIASGGESGAYFAFAQEYAERFEQEGIELEIINTGGSVENIQLLHDEKVDIAFVQSGIEDVDGQHKFRSLGSLYYEPLWLFHRKDITLDRLPELAERRVAIGSEGSGTQALVRTLISENGLAADELNLKMLGGKSAVDALVAGDIDAAFFVTSAKSELIQTLLRNPEIQISSFERAEAYSRRFRFLNSVKLPEGVVDLEANIPVRNIDLLAPAANLVVREGLHPTVIDLLLLSASDAHSKGDWFEQRDEFPKAALLAYPLAKDAARYYKNGPPLLQRYLPFWAASLIDRLKVMILPLVFMLLPLIKIMPPIYSWRMRARVYRWYDELEKVDKMLFQSGEIDEQEQQALSAELNRIESDVREVRVPLSFSSQVYHLRLHIDHVRHRLDDKLGSI